MHTPFNRQFPSRLLSCLTTILPAGARPHAARKSAPPSHKTASDDSFVHVEAPTPAEIEEQQSQQSEPEPEPEPEPEEDPQMIRDLLRKEALDSLETVVCAEQVKRQLKAIAQWVQICRRHGEDPRKDWYNMVFQGNPGTGTLPYHLGWTIVS